MTTYAICQVDKGELKCTHFMSTHFKFCECKINKIKNNYIFCIDKTQSDIKTTPMTAPGIYVIEDEETSKMYIMNETTIDRL